MTKDDGPRKDDDRRNKVSPDRKGIPIDSTKPSGINVSNCIKLCLTIFVLAVEEQKSSKSKGALEPKPGVSDVPKKDDGKVALNETKSEPDISSQKQAETVGNGWQATDFIWKSTLINFVNFQLKKS